MKRIILVILVLLQVNLFAQTRIVKEIVSVGVAPKLSNSNGVVYSAGESKPFTGTYMKLDFDSTMIKEVHYVKGKTQGKYIEYYKGKTTVKYLREYNAGVLIKETEYFDDGSLREERNYNSKGQPHGEWNKYNYGSLTSSLKFDNGKRLN